MSRRTYNQTCWLARALDYVGDRWTLLMVRELLSGPKRFKDLLGALPGIGTNLLSARLKQLESDGLVSHRQLPLPAASRVYELTEAGQGLESIVLGLARWGRELPGRTKGKQAFQPTYVLVAMKAVFVPEEAAGVCENYEYRVGEDVFHTRIEDGALEVGLGPAPNPAFVFKTDPRSFMKMADGSLSPEEAMQAGRLQVEGSREALERSFRIFSG